MIGAAWGAGEGELGGTWRGVGWWVVVVVVVVV
eukprot:COSAG02_NODE_50514_length_320_cov_0.656109_1_plen_32_part_01